MKVEKTNVHRLSVERECGCLAVREYRDPQYKDAISDAEYVPCKKHKAKNDLQEMMQMIMVEDLEREATTTAAAAVAAAERPHHPIPTATSLDGSSGETVTSTPINRRSVRAASLAEHLLAPAPASGGAPLPQNGPRRDPTQVRTINRDHNVNRRAAISGRTPVTGVTVSNPATGGARRPQTVKVGAVELATPGMDLDIDMEVAEDPRVTALTENALLPDLEDDPSQA